MRACDFGLARSPWGRPHFQVGDREVGVVEASRTGLACVVAPGTVGEIRGAGVTVACRDEWVLVDALLVDGEVEDAASILAGLARGAVLGEAKRGA